LNLYARNSAATGPAGRRVFMRARKRMWTRLITKPVIYTLVRIYRRCCIVCLVPACVTRARRSV